MLFLQQKQMKKSSTPSTILMILKEVGAITIDAFFNPKYAKKYGYTPTNFSKGSSACRSAFTRLQSKNLIKQKGDLYYLTTEGQKEAFLCFVKSGKFSQFLKNENKKWDGKWRIMFFDIPEKKRGKRDELRVMLKAVGFKEFQKSAWVYPYKVPNFLKELLFEENIKPYTRLITTTSIEYDKDLKRMFDLDKT